MYTHENTFIIEDSSNLSHGSEDRLDANVH